MDYNCAVRLNSITEYKVGDNVAWTWTHDITSILDVGRVVELVNNEEMPLVIFENDRGARVSITLRQAALLDRDKYDRIITLLTRNSGEQS